MAESLGDPEVLIRIRNAQGAIVATDSTGTLPARITLETLAANQTVTLTFNCTVQ